MIEKLRVRIPAGAAEEFSSPELTLCADSYSVSVRTTPVLPQWYVKDPGNCRKCRWQVTAKHAYNLDPTKLEWADFAVQAQCGNPSGKRAHTQLVREHSATVVSAR